MDGRVLKTVVTSSADLPDFVKTASRLTETQLHTTSDDHFALVMLDEGRKLKKYATVDAGNTALSVMYLLKQAHLLPPEAVKIAASNLIGACVQHGLAVPAHLKIAAKSGYSPVSGKSQKLYTKDAKVSTITFPIKEPGKESTTNPQLGKHDAANADVEERTNLGGTPGTNAMVSPLFATKEKIKQAGAFGDVDGDVVIKQKSWRQVPYVDMSNWDPAAAQMFETKPAELTLLDGDYAVDGYDQVKTASAYFEENWRDFSPRKRHEYCVGLVSRLEKLGMAISEDVMRYGSQTYAADASSYVEARRSYIHDEYKPALDVLLEKRAQVRPDTFAEALLEFDNMTDLRWHWGSKVADPWYSTFGPSFEKLAEDDWRYDQDGTRCDLAQLKELALNGHSDLCKQFGHAFADEFAKKPKEIFESMPTPNKKVLARMASGVQDYR